MNRISLLFAAHLFATNLVAQNIAKTILWEVTKKGNIHKSYLFGTFHEVSPAFFMSLTNSLSKLNQSEVLFVEEQVERATDSQSLNSILRSQWDYEKWKSILTDQQDSIFSAFVKKSGDSNYYELSPSFLTVKVSRLYMKFFCESDTTFINTLMDTYIEGLAKKQKKKVYSLDGNQANMLKKEDDSSRRALYSSSASTIIHFMQAMLDNDFLDCEIMNTYKKFELKYDFNTDLTRKTSDFSLLVARNNKWLSILSQSFLNNNCFVAVGFRHLFYKQGLIQQLKNLGYRVEPISP